MEGMRGNLRKDNKEKDKGEKEKMKGRRFLASVLAGLMAVTSVPVMGFDLITVMAADREARVASPSLADVAENPVTMRLKDGSSLNVVKDETVGTAFSGQFEATGDHVSKLNFKDTTRFAIRFQVKADDNNAMNSVIGKMNNQYGVQIDGGENERLIFYAQAHNTETNNTNWVETAISLTSDFWGKWHEVIAYYDGTKLRLALDDNMTSTDKRNQGVSLVENTSNKFTVGYSSTDGANTFPGQLANVRIYSGEEVPAASEAITAESLKTSLDALTPVFKLQPSSGEETQQPEEVVTAMNELQTTLERETDKKYIADNYSKESWKAYWDKFTAAARLLGRAQDGDPDVTAEMLTTAKTNVIEASAILSRVAARFENPENGVITPTEEDLNLINTTKNFVVNVVFKYNKANPQKGIYAPLLTLTGSENRYFTAWHNPKRDTAGTYGTQGTVAYDMTGNESGFQFSYGSSYITDTKWHKLSLTISTDDEGKAQQIFGVMDGQHTIYSGQVQGYTISGTKFADSINGFLNGRTGDWKITGVQIGTVPSGLSYQHSLTALDGAVKYAEVSNSECKTAEEAVAENARVGMAVKEKYDTLLETCGNLVESEYTADSWTAFQTALAANTGKTTEWEIYNAIDALEAAKTALVKDTPAAECTCQIGDISFANATIDMGTAATKTYNLNATAPVTGNCSVVGHGTAAFTYTITEGSNIAGIQGNVLTVTGAGTVKVKAVAAAGSATKEKVATFTVTKNAPVVECTCQIGDITFADASIDMGTAASKTYNLNATAPVSGDCKVSGHGTASVTYTVTAGADIASIRGNVLTVTGAGTVKVKAAVTAGNAKKEKEASFTVSSDRADAEAVNALKDLVKEIKEKYQKDNYTAESYLTLENAIKDAETAANATEPSKSAIESARQGLEQAVSGLKAVEKEDDREPAEVTAAKAAVRNALAAAKPVYDAGQKDYTDATWKAFADAYKAAQNPAANADAAALNALAAALTKAQTGLIRAAAPVVPVEPGKVYDSGNYSYKVLSVADLTVEVTALKNAALTSIKIYNTVTLGGKSFRVTSVAPSVFKNNKKIKTVVIGKNVTKIGKDAFSGCTGLKKLTLGVNVKTIDKNSFKNCKKLSSIVVKGKTIKTIKSGAFKKTAAKMTVKVPKKLTKKQRTVLMKKFTKAGVTKKAKMK